MKASLWSGMPTVNAESDAPIKKDSATALDPGGTQTVLKFPKEPTNRMKKSGSGSAGIEPVSDGQLVIILRTNTTGNAEVGTATAS